MKKKVLYNNKWINLVELDNWYVCTDEVRTKNNNFVCVLPYAYAHNYAIGMDKMMPSIYLLRKEYNPAHDKYNLGLHRLGLSCITGQCETGSIKYHAVQELKEEGGYTIPADRFIYLGSCMPLKSSMANMHLFAVCIDTTDVPHKATGDGTKGEENAHPIWETKSTLLQCKDPYIHTAFLRLEKWISDELYRKDCKELEKNIIYAQVP